MPKRIFQGSGGGKKGYGGFPVSQFIALSDAPHSYAGQANKFVTVKAGENGLEFIPLPPLAITDTFVVASEVAMLALTAQRGDVAIRTDINQSFILTTDDPTLLINWAMLLVSPVHAFGGALHTADTLANLKTKVSAPDKLLTSDAAEIAAFTAKGTPTTADLLVIEDAADSNKKKKITIATLPAAAPAAHAFGGALHTADTLANLKTKVSAPDTLLTSDAAEIAAFTAVSTANNLENNLMVIEDVNDTNKKKKMTLLTLKEIFFRFPEFHYTADQARPPIASDFPVNGENFAALMEDSLKNSIMVREFLAASKTGVCLDFYMPGVSPSGIPTNLVLQIAWRQQTAEAAGKYLQLAMYTRQLASGAAAPAWTAKQSPVATEGSLTLPCSTDTNWQLSLVRIPLANFSTPLVYARPTQIELIRDTDSADDTAVNKTNISFFRIAFS
jgi:hypothetical protein